MASILYVGPDTGTSRHRFHALLRMGHDVKLIDPFLAFGRAPRLMTWGFKTGYFGLERKINAYVLGQVGDATFDVVWVDNGETIGRELVGRLKSLCRVILNHNLDNPYTRRDGQRWRLFLASLSLYDLVVVPRDSTRDAALAHGARQALSVMFTADERVHRPVVLSTADRAKFGAEVSFVGTWMPERGPFMKHLLDLGVPLRIFGPRWTKAPEYRDISWAVTCGSLDDEDYVKAVAACKIAIGLLSLGNQDLHTTRSLEVPAIGTLLCAPRTSVHEALYKDGDEAVFFDDAPSCAAACLALLKDHDRLETIARAGHRRNLQNNWFNERLLSDILARLGIVSPSTQPDRPLSEKVLRHV